MGWSCGRDSSTLPSNELNAKGFFERKDVVSTNEALLIEASRANLADAISSSEALREDVNLGGQAWFFGPWAIARAEFHPAPESIRRIKDAVARMLDEVGSSIPFVLKDPRLCVTFPLWQPHLPACQVIGIVRCPFATAASLKKLYGFPDHLNLAAWAVYTLHALKHVNQSAGIILLQEDLLGDPAHVLRDLLEHLGGSNRTEEDIARGIEFLDADLVHQRMDPELSEGSPFSRIYSSLKEGAQSDAIRQLEVFVESAVALECWTEFCLRLETYELMHRLHLCRTDVDQLHQDPVIGRCIRVVRRIRRATDTRMDSD